MEIIMFKVSWTSRNGKCLYLYVNLVFICYKRLIFILSDVNLISVLFLRSWKKLEGKCYELEISVFGSIEVSSYCLYAWTNNYEIMLENCLKRNVLTTLIWILEITDKWSHIYASFRNEEAFHYLTAEQMGNSYFQPALH